MNKQLRGSLILLLTAFIWGTAFVAQSEGVSKIGVWAFSAIRNALGVIVLIPVIVILRKKKNEKGTTTVSVFSDIMHDKRLLIGGLLCGIALFVAANLQQFGIKYVSFVGKAGFLTALYIILVPILGLFLHKKVGKLVWVGLLFALVGLYLLCINQTIKFEAADILLIACAFVFSIQILLVDKYVLIVDPIALACIEFFVCGALSFICMLIFENNSIEAIKSVIIPLLYAGCLSSGVAYTLQMVGQRDLNPTLASMIMSLEAVISAISGIVLLHERPSARELIGCVLMFVGVILAQIPTKDNN